MPTPAQTAPETNSSAPDAAERSSSEPESRPSCPAPADIRAEVAAYDREADVGTWDGPRYRITYRVLGQGPPLILCPGIASTYRGFAIMLNRLASRFKTVVYDYPGEHQGDGAKLDKLTHDNYVDDALGLIDHLQFGRAFLVGLSFGSTVVLKALEREPRRFPKAVIQGAFARREFTGAERGALWVGRRFPGRVASLPLHGPILSWNNKYHFPDVISDRWQHFVEQNGLTPIAGLSRRLDLLSHLDLRPSLGHISTEILVLHGNEDRLVPRKYFEELTVGLKNSRGVLMPLVGHQPHYTHPEGLAQAILDYCLPCNPEGCPNETAVSESTKNVSTVAEDG